MKNIISNHEFIETMNLHEKIKCPCCQESNFILFYGLSTQTCSEFDNTKITKDDLLPRLTLSFHCQSCDIEFYWILMQRHSHGVHSIDFQILKKSRIENQIMQQKRKSLPAGLRYQILDRDNYTCQACGAKPGNGALLEIDHIYPVSKGGSDIPANLRTLCRTCNRGKGDKIYGDN